MMSRSNQDVSVDVVREWASDFSLLWECAGRCFRRSDTRGHAEGYVRALLGRIDRKNGWQMAEYLGAGSPYPIQHFLGRANWSADVLRDEVLRYSREHLTTSGENGVLIVDETGFLKKGDKSVGVPRQYSGTAGRIESGSESASRRSVWTRLAGSLRWRIGIACGCNIGWIGKGCGATLGHRMLF